jgi:gliding motility-associated-like protein
VSVSDANCGGTFEGEAVVNFNPGVLAEISPGGGVCPGESLTLHANGIGGVPPYSYQWFNADNDAWVQFDDSITVSPFTDMNIYVVVTDQCGSTAHSDTVLAYPHQMPLASFDFSPRHDLTVQNTTIYYNSETSLFAHALYWEFYELTDNGWQLIGTSYEANPVFTYPDDAPGEYQACLYVTTINGCTHQMCLPLEILGTFVFYMPNAFTPNEDGINDLYGPVMEGVDPDAYEFFIVNRWGETVFYTNDIDQKWNGSGMNGTHYAPDGVIRGK